MAGGTRSHKFHGGAKSEYFATYLFSWLGLVTPVPRPEDIGYDLVCSIADNSGDLQTFNHPFLVSVKSLSSPEIELTPADSFEVGEAKEMPHFHWLFRLQLPLFLCVVDKYKSHDIRLYSTSAAWFIYHQKEYQDCGSLTLLPRTKADDRGFQLPIKGDPVKGLAGYFNYIVDLGHPLVRFSADEVATKERIAQVRQELREAVTNDAVASLQARLGIPYFQWFATTSIDQSKKNPAFFVATPSIGTGVEERIFTELAPTLFSLALMFRESKRAELLAAVEALIKLVPAGSARSGIWEKVQAELAKK